MTQNDVLLTEFVAKLLTYVWYILILLFLIFFIIAKPSKKLIHIYLANDVVQNSKKKGPEFNREFSGIIVAAYKHVYRFVFLFSNVNYFHCGPV